MTGAESLLHTLLANHIDICFMNPGTSEMQFASALDLLGLFEGVCSTLGRSLTTSSHLHECRHPPSRVRSGPEPLLGVFPVSETQSVSDCFPECPGVKLEAWQEASKRLTM